MRCSTTTRLTGLDRIAGAKPRRCSLVRAAQLGLLAHPASVDAALRHAEQPCCAARVRRCRALFGPEHGYGGEAQDMIGVAGERRGAVPGVLALRRAASKT